MLTGFDGIFTRFLVRIANFKSGDVFFEPVAAHDSAGSVSLKVSALVVLRRPGALWLAALECSWT